MQPPHDIEKTGRFAILTDPQGAAFAVFKFAGA
jgi:predicted enzyme related to lactoylglutathione lyase